MISKKLSIVHCQLSIILAFLPLSVAYAQQDSTLNRTVAVSYTHLNQDVTDKHSPYNACYAQYQKYPPAPCTPIIFGLDHDGVEKTDY